jgi:hypothetical protein
MAISQPCTLDFNADESAFAMILIPADIMRRIKTRAHNQDYADYIWLNIMKPALNSHVY